jgi:ABC-type glycerol-3-phosphate transport system substrate-binding protein
METMQRRQYLQAAVGTSTALFTGLAGCSSLTGDDGTETDDGAETDDGTDTYDGPGSMEIWHDKGQDPNWNPAFDEVIPVINDQQDKVTVEANPFQSTDGFQGSIRPVLGTEDGPGVFGWWTGARLRNIAEDGFAMDVTDIWQDHIDNDEYPESMIDTYGADGSAYAMPLQTSYWSVWYNTETFNELGVSPPETWEEFNQLCEDILSESNEETTPIALPLSPGWTGFIWFEELVLRESLEFYQQLCQGEAAYTDETSVNALETIGQMQENGYFGPASESFEMGLDTLPGLMDSGDYAMTLLGDWFSTLFGEDLDFGKYDWFELPPINPEVDQMLIAEPTPLVPHTGWPNEAGIEAVADAILSPEFQEAWAKAQNVDPPNAEVDTSFLPDNIQSLADTVASGEYSFPLRYWENTSPDVAVPASSSFQEIYQNPGNAQSILESVDQTRQEVYE